jgi:hypothetical protein
MKWTRKEVAIREQLQIQTESIAAVLSLSSLLSTAGHPLLWECEELAIHEPAAWSRATMCSAGLSQDVLTVPLLLITRQSACHKEEVVPSCLLQAPLPSCFLFLLGGTGVWTQDLEVAKQALYCLSHSTNSVLCWVFLR